MSNQLARLNFDVDCLHGDLSQAERNKIMARFKAGELAVLVAALEPPDREIFLRKYYLMQSSREIAAALDLRVSTVNTRLSRGRDRLRRQLQERGYTHG